MVLFVISNIIFPLIPTPFQRHLLLPRKDLEFPENWSWSDPSACTLLQHHLREQDALRRFEIPICVLLDPAARGDNYARHAMLCARRHVPEEVSAYPTPSGPISRIRGLHRHMESQSAGNIFYHLNTFEHDTL
jgi:hypothetical protein